MTTADNVSLYQMYPEVAGLNRVSGFDPLKFLRHTAQGPVLDLKYKKLWFRMKYPAGKIRLAALKITEQTAIIEASIYFDCNDTHPRSSFIAQRDAAGIPDGRYIEAAQQAAIDRALSDAGFGVQFAKPVPPEESAESAPSILPAVETAPEEPAAAPREAEPIAEAEAIQNVDNVIPMPEAVVPVYTPDMTVEEICAKMTLEEARSYIVPSGTCRGWTLAQVAERRPASLRWYLTGYPGTDNLLRAGAKLMLEQLQKAG